MFGWFKKKKSSDTAKEANNIAPIDSAPKIKTSKKSTKDVATEKGEPYVAILSLEVDPNNMHQGAFELDWNEIFVSRLVKAGYMIKKDDTDAEIVDRWFQTVCRHVVMETWEQEQAMRPGQWTRVKDLGDGRTEVS